VEEWRFPPGVYLPSCLVCGNSWSKTVGVFWHNAAETWVDITNAAANKVQLEQCLWQLMLQ